MARRRQSSGSALVVGIAAVVALISKIPFEVWIFLIVVGIVIVVIKANSRSQKTQVFSGSPGLAAPIRKRETPKLRGAIANTPTLRMGADVESSGNRQIPAPPQGEVAYKARWVPKGEVLNVAGFDNVGGMLYAGLSLKAASGQQEPALINPSLKVCSTWVDVSDQRMSYWPSYSEITPEARRAYLQWLATGRKDPAANVGYAFLYFYGLERRALIDLQSSPADPEIRDIISEVERLLSIYGNSGSFRNYATNFLGYLLSGCAPSDQSSTVPLQAVRSYELPLSYRIALGQFAINRKPVPVEWALSWAMVDPAISCRTPVQRCPEQFQQLFKREYAAAFGDGLVLPINKTKLRISYRPASGGFWGSVVSRDMGDLPDIGAVTGPQKKLQDIVDCCTEQLERYSRFIGRNPDKATSLEATVLLPAQLWPKSMETAVTELKQLTSRSEFVITWRDLLSRFGQTQAVSRPLATQVATQLEVAGVALEPDLLGRGRIPEMEDYVVAFSTSARDEKVMSSAAYTAAAVTMDFGCMAAASDGEAHDLEVQHLLNAIDSWEGVDDAARQRLKARLRLNVAQPPALSTLRKKAECLSPESRMTIANLLVEVVKADGAMDPAEVKLLESAYKVLQLDPKLAYSALHADGMAKPMRGKGMTRGQIALNAERIAHLQRETDRIAVVLNEVFSEDQLQANTPLEPSDGEEAALDCALLGLDSEHAPFARLLLSRPQWSRAELADAAVDMGLMLDGALERINDAAFEKLGSAIAEGDDPVEVDQKLMEHVVA